MADKITAGKLDKRITFLIPVLHYNDFNEQVQTFEVFAEVWAGEHDVSTAESMRAQEVGAQLNARFTVRYSEISARVDARFRILYNGKEYNITGVRNLGRNTWIEIDAVIRAESSEAFEVSSP